MFSYQHQINSLISCFSGKREGFLGMMIIGFNGLDSNLESMYNRLLYNITMNLLLLELGKRLIQPLIRDFVAKLLSSKELISMFNSNRYRLNSNHSRPNSNHSRLNSNNPQYLIILSLSNNKELTIKINNNH